MNRFAQVTCLILSIGILSISISYAKPIKIKDAENIKEVYQLFNRMNWRIQKINQLVNTHKKDNEFRLISYEIDRLVLLIDLAEKQFVPKEKKDVVLPLVENMRNTCTELSQKAKEHSAESIKESTSKLFRAYTEFKLSLKEKPVSELQ